MVVVECLDLKLGSYILQYAGVNVLGIVAIKIEGVYRLLKVLYWYELIVLEK